MIRIHLVDDDDGIREAVSMMLEARGYAAEAHASVEALVSSPTWPDARCVIADLGLQGTSGETLAERLSRSEHRARLIILTGHLGDGVEELLDLPAVDAVLHKPCPPDRLTSAVARCLARAQPRTAEPWSMLVVDDDPQVSDVTELALYGLKVGGRPLRLHHARSGLEAMECLDGATYDVVLLDIVMETDRAGFEVLDQLTLLPRPDRPVIVVRTGQPGIAPRSRTLAAYPIDAYWSKTDIDARRMRDQLTALLRRRGGIA